MDKMTFASYKFKPSDVIEGLNRYFAETKAFRYRGVPLEIENGEVKTGIYYVLRNVVFVSMSGAPKVKECGYYYIICDPEEVVGVAINWLREEYDIFYTPGMEVPVEDFDIDEAAKEYEKATRKDLKEALQRRLYDANRRIIALEAGHAEKTKIIDRQVARIMDLEKSIAEKNDRIDGLKADVDITSMQLKEQREFITKVAELLETRDPYIERQYKAAIEKLRTAVTHPNRYKWLYENLKTCIQSDLEEAASYEED